MPRILLLLAVIAVAYILLTRARNEKVKAFYDFHLADVALERVLQRGPTRP